MVQIPQYRESEKLKQEGTWVHAASADGWSFKIRRIGTTEWLKARKDATRHLYGLFPQTDIDEDKITAHILADEWITDWQSPEFDFTRENARKLFLNPEYWNSLNNELVIRAVNFEHYLKELADDDDKALKKD